MPGYDYTTVGHVTADVLADGSRRAGGSAFYSALQAARLGRRALIVTQGVRAEIEELLAPYRAELELHIRPAPHTTTLHTRGHGGARTQRMLAWAGPMEPPDAVDTAILHLAPVARETTPAWRGRADFVGLTPQGLVRTWTALGAPVGQLRLDPSYLPERCEAIVISEAERESCAWLIAVADRADGRPVAAGKAAGAWAGGAGALVAVTAGARATVLHVPGGGTLSVQVPAIEHFVDDIGAGDVFAAAFFTSLHDGSPPHQAAAFGNAAAALRIGGAGALAVGQRHEIEARVRTVA